MWTENEMKYTQTFTFLRTMNPLLNENAFQKRQNLISRCVIYFAKVDTFHRYYS